MKRYTAILVVLCVALSAFSCSGDGTAVPSQGTTAQNTAESIKTESTTSKTEATEKPEFLHPAIEEINESIDKTLASDHLSAEIHTDFFVFDAAPGTGWFTTHRQNVFSEQEENAQEKFLIETSGEQDMDPILASSVLFDGSSYYISHLGVNAKIPKSGVSSVTPPRELISPAIPKLASDKDISHFDIDIDPDFSSYHYGIPGEFLNTTFCPLTSALKKEIGKRTDIPFELTTSISNINITVNADGTLAEYLTAFSATLNLVGEEFRMLKITAEVKVTFSPAESELSAPENAQSFITLGSEQEIPFTALKKATEKTAQSKILFSSDIITVSKKELDGSITPMEISSQKIYDGSNMSIDFSVKKQSGAPLSVGSAVFAKGACYLLENRYTVAGSPPSEIKTRYSPEDFEALYGYRDMYVPHVFDSGEVVFTHQNYPLRSGSISTILEFTVSEEEFLRSFGAQAAAVARAVAGGREIWRYDVKNCSVSVYINKEGYIEFYNIRFETEVNVIINGKKFALKAEATDVFTISSDAQSIKVNIPNDAEIYTPYPTQTQN